MTIFRLQLCFVNCGQHYIVVAYDRLILVAVRQLAGLYGVCCLLHRVDLGTQYSLEQNHWDLDQLNLPPWFHAAQYKNYEVGKYFLSVTMFSKVLIQLVF